MSPDLPELPELPDLPPMDVAARADRVRHAVDAAGCDALVVTDRSNVAYLTGFTGSNAVLVVRDDRLVLVTDGRYRDQADDQLAAAGVEAELVITRHVEEPLAAAVSDLHRLGLEADHVTWDLQARWAEALRPELVPTTGMVLGLRSVKDDGEVARLAHAAAIADDALAEVRPLLAEGATEVTVARALEAAMADRGAEGPAFETIVASGPNGARPHARPSHRVVGASGGPELVVIDFGARYQGYHSDMTRTLVMGDPTPTQQAMFDVVSTAQAAGVDAVRAGVPARSVDRACRDVVDGAGWADAFVHGTGHGVGLEIHEAPRLHAESSDALAEGNCVTVEPGVYLRDHGGVRIEDTVVVTADGCRVLTCSPYAPTP